MHSSKQMSNSIPLTEKLNLDYLMMFSSVVSVGLLLISTILASQFLGNSDNWIQIKQKVTQLWIFTIIGTIALFIASLMYISKYKENANILFLIFICFSLGLSFSAFAMSAITKT